MFTRRKTSTAVILFLLAIRQVALAEDLPTRGTFDGIYHCDRWGVGHFSFFLVDPAVAKRLAEHEGRRVSITVTKGKQPWNPGPAIIEEISGAARLPESPLRVRLRTVFSPTAASTPFQLVCELENTAEKPLWVLNSDVMIRICRAEETPKADEPSWLFPAYTRAQMAVKTDSVQMFQCLVKTSAGRYSNLAHSNGLLIRPGEMSPLVLLFDGGLSRGEYEVGASARSRDQERGGELPESAAWLRLDVGDGQPGPSQPWKPLRIARKSIEALDDGYRLHVVFEAPAGQQRAVMQPCDDDKRACVGSLRALAEDKTEIELQVSQQHGWEDPWSLRPVPADGLALDLEFRQKSRFCTHAIRTLTLDLLTDKGIERFSLAESFQDVHVPAVLPPFGECVQGVQLRGRPAREVFKAGEALRFHMQAVNVSGKPVGWRGSHPSLLGGNGDIRIDGNSIQLPQRRARDIWGWAAEWTCAIPQEWTLRLPEDLELAPGQHTLTYVITSSGGSYKNANNDYVPLLEGTLKSNEIVFVIE